MAVRPERILVRTKSKRRVSKAGCACSGQVRGIRVSQLLPQYFVRRGGCWLRRKGSNSGDRSEGKPTKGCERCLSLLDQARKGHTDFLSGVTLWWPAGVVQGTTVVLVPARQRWTPAGWSIIAGGTVDRVLRTVHSSSPRNIGTVPTPPRAPVQDVNWARKDWVGVRTGPHCRLTRGQRWSSTDGGGYLASTTESRGDGGLLSLAPGTIRLYWYVVCSTKTMRPCSRFVWPLPVMHMRTVGILVAAGWQGGRAAGWLCGWVGGAWPLLEPCLEPVEDGPLCPANLDINNMAAGQPQGWPSLFHGQSVSIVVATAFTLPMRTPLRSSCRM